MKLHLFALGSIAALASALPADANNQDSKPAAATFKEVESVAATFKGSQRPPNSPSFSTSRPGLGKTPYGGYYNDYYYGYSDYDSYDGDYDSYNDYESYGYNRKKRDAPYGGDYGYGYDDYNNYYSGYNSYGYGYGRK
ncbi:hypothetical protein HK100_009576 [Physocladia obscura]|uniref:Uncharacterized protein n=1 Tax=Physocladia obscura TaxID=109957 RepID=A0AAD5X5Y9_9FUNG|nr:hypothetical protein HK100_009576 [Physocladia obscura]